MRNAGNRTRARRAARSLGVAFACALLLLPGAGAGAGANKNLPLPPGAGDESWLDAVKELATWASAGGATSLVVPLGVDAAAGDPESPLRVTETAFRRAGRVLGELGLPTVLVQEGGYDLEALGQLVREVLLGVEEGAA